MANFNPFILILSVILLITVHNKAQIVIKGRVLTPAGLPVTNVPIVLKPITNENILTYSLTSEEGIYELSYNGKLDSLRITVSGFNISSQSRTIKALSQTIDFKIEEKAIQLREVKVKATKIWGTNDTINYLTSSFSDKRDLVIGDVLRKMPGIIVKESGEILFEGKPINKFYIENLDLLQGRYGIAINNISAIDVSTVQILQNHQPIKALAKSQISSDAAINLKLKEGAKGTLSIMAQLGIGAVPFLGENELSGMYFNKEKQNISTFKENNTGIDLSNELRSFTPSNNLSDAKMVSVQMPATPDISQKRYLFNNSNAATINNLIKLNSGRQFTFNLIYLNDYQTQQSTAISSYYLPGDSILKINENLSAIKNVNRFETKLKYNVNEEKYYLNNDFNVEGLWEVSSGEIINDQIIKQNLNHTSFAVTNNFNFVRKRDDLEGIEINSNNSYRTTPEALTLHPGLYTDIFMDNNPYNALVQQIRLNTFQSRNNLSFLSSLVFHKIRINPTFGLNIESQQLNSELGPMDDNEKTIHAAPDSLRNNLDWLKSDINMAVNTEYSEGRFGINLNMPVSYKILILKNKIPGEKLSNDYLFFEPRVYLQYKINSKFNISSSYTLNNQLGNIQTLYPGYILQSYRNINAYNNKLSKAKTIGGNISLSYRDLVSALFINISLIYNHTKRDVLYGQDFSGNMSKTYAIGKGNISENRLINGMISKGYDFWHIVFTLEGMYGKYASEQLRQKELLIYNNEGGNISGSFNVKPISWISLSYKGTLGENRGKIKNGESLPSIRTNVNNVNINLYLPKDLNFNINYENYYNSASKNNKFISFTDLGVWYSWKKIRFSLDWTNIFNTQKYTTSYYNNISAYQYQYEIRPSSILFKLKFKLR